MLCTRKAKLYTAATHMRGIFKLHGARSTSKWQSSAKRNPRLAGVLLGAGCAIAVGASIGFAFGEKKHDDSACENDLIYESSCDIGSQSSSVVKEDDRKQQLKEAVKKSILKLEQVKEETGSPGLVCAVSIDGKLVMATGLGFADVENGVKCHGGTVMRIASISKALTSIAIGKLLQENKADLDAPVQQYAAYFPEKEYNGEVVAITMRQLMSHTSGIRHYVTKLQENEAKLNEEGGQAEMKSDEIKSFGAVDKILRGATAQSEADRKIRKGPKSHGHDDIMPGDEKDIKGKKEQNKSGDVQFKEFYIREHYDTVKDAIGIFKDDPLLKMPGSDYLYTTHGWTLLSACIEGASGKDYVTFMKEMCYDLGLDNTFVELNDPIIYNRSRYYLRDLKGKLKNTPYVDNSYKWAGGGFLSSVGDLIKIGNIMLYSFQCTNPTLWKKKGYLNKDIVDRFWTPEQATVGKVSKKRKEAAYGLGWQLLSNYSSYGCCRKTKFAAFHTGSAVGASSILLIVPNGPSEEDSNIVKGMKEKEASGGKIADGSGQQSEQRQIEEISEHRTVNSCKEEFKPQGIVVAIIANIQEVSLVDTALNIAENFTFEL